MLKKNMLKSLLPHIIAVVTIIGINVVYFYPQLSGKLIQQSDILASQQATKTLKEYNDANDKKYLWNPAQFGGMPTLANPYSNTNLISKFYPILRVGFEEPMGMFIAGCLMAYFSLVLLGFSPWLSLLFCIPMVFATNNLILYEAGHNSKIRTLIFTPLLIAGVLNIFENRKYLLGGILLTLGFAFSLYTRHPQMTYYILMVFMIYGIIVFIQTIKNKDWSHLGKGVSITLIALLLGLTSSATKTWSMYDYSKSTMRGDAILEDQANTATPSSSVDGLDWDYATQWSNGAVDIMAGYIPGFAGGGGAEKVSRNSQSYKNYRMEQAPLYWGELPFTVGPIYFGASIVFLFVLSLFLLQGNLKWWLGIGAVWMILLSMGKHFSTFNQIMFEYFPFYAKFRAPQTVLNVSSFFFALLAAFGFKEIISRRSKTTKKGKVKEDKHALKQLYMSYSICAAVALLFALGGSSIFEFNSLADPSYTQRGLDVSHFISDRKSLLQGDSWRTLIIISLLAGLIWAYLKAKLGKTLLIAGCAVVIAFDFFGVNLRYLDHKKFVRQNNYNQNFAERPVDKQIKSLENDKSQYRVLDLSINTFNSASTSGHHNTIGGSDPAKLQRIQDIFYRHVVNNNMRVLNMLNTKYFIVNQENGPAVQTNPEALGTAWFVNNIRTVNSPLEEINALNEVDPANEAVVLSSEFPGSLDGINPGTNNGNIQMNAYEPDRITYKSNNTQQALAVFSEVWYGPNKGWNAYIDGQPVDHIRANYVLRALNVPAGEHEIIFEFKPRTHALGETISLISSILILGALLWFLFQAYRNGAKEEVIA